MWVDFLCFVYVVFGSLCKTFTSIQHILWPSSYTCWANFDFSSRPCVRLYIWSLMCTSKGQLGSLMLTSATSIWDVAYMLLHPASILCSLKLSTSAHQLCFPDVLFEPCQLPAFPVTGNGLVHRWVNLNLIWYQTLITGTEMIRKH
jgi:hypothetical protein